jgi:hypothetical protein
MYFQERTEDMERSLNSYRIQEGIMMETLKVIFSRHANLYCICEDLG